MIKKCLEYLNIYRKFWKVHHRNLRLYRTIFFFLLFIIVKNLLKIIRIECLFIYCNWSGNFRMIKKYFEYLDISLNKIKCRTRIFFFFKLFILDIKQFNIYKTFKYYKNEMTSKIIPYSIRIYRNFNIVDPSSKT